MLCASNKFQFIVSTGLHSHAGWRSSGIATSTYKISAKHQLRILQSINYDCAGHVYFLYQCASVVSGPTPRNESHWKVIPFDRLKDIKFYLYSSRWSGTSYEAKRTVCVYANGSKFNISEIQELALLRSKGNPMAERKKPLKKGKKGSDLAVVKIDSLAKCPWNGAVLFSGCPIIAAWPWMPRISKRITAKNSSISTETIRPNVKR